MINQVSLSLEPLRVRTTRPMNVAAALIGHAYSMAMVPIDVPGLVKVAVCYLERLRPAADGAAGVYNRNEGVALWELPWDGRLPEGSDRWLVRCWCLDMLHEGFSGCLRHLDLSAEPAEAAYRAVVDAGLRCEWRGPGKRDRSTRRYARAAAEASEEGVCAWVEVSDSRDFAEVRVVEIDPRGLIDIHDARKRMGNLRWAADGRVLVAAKPQQRIDPWPDVVVDPGEARPRP